MSLAGSRENYRWVQTSLSVRQTSNPSFHPLDGRDQQRHP